MSEQTNEPSGSEVSTETLKSTDTRVLKAEPASPQLTDVVDDESKTLTPNAKSTEAEEPDDDDDEDTHDDAKPADASKRDRRLPRWMRERLDRAERVAAERARTATIRELQDMGVIQTRQPAAEAVDDTSPMKTLADFDFDQDAYIAYKVDEGIKQTKDREQREAQAVETKKAQETASERIREFERRVGEGAWDEIVAASGKIVANPMLVGLIQDSGHDLDVALHLSRNPDLANEIAKMTPLKMARAIEEVAAQFETPADKPKAELPPKKLTKAPEPPKTVTAGSRADVDLNNPNISAADRIKGWAKQRAAGQRLT